MTATFGPDGKTNFTYSPVAAAGPRVATRIRRSNRKRMLRAATARVRSDLNSRTGWRHSFAEGGDFVPLPPGVPNSLSIRSPCTVFSTKTSLLRGAGGGLGQNPLRRTPKNTRLFAIWLSTSQKHETFAIGNSKNTINFEVSDQQKRPNLVHSDSKPCFSALGRSPRPPAIDFLGLSGSRAPDPSQTSLQAVFSSNPFKNTRFWPSECIETLQITRFPLPAAHRNASKRWPRLGFSRGLREQRPAPKPT